MATTMKRQPAKKFWIADVLNAKASINEQGFRQFTIREKGAARVNLVAVIVSVYVNEAGSYAVAVADDGSAQIRLKAWNEDAATVGKAAPGDIMLIIGRLNMADANNEVFIKPEIMRTKSIEWMELRRAELLKEFGEAKKAITREEPPQEEVLVEEQMIGDENAKCVPLAVRERIIQAIEANDNADGASISEVIANAGTEAEASAAIDELIREGEAFQPKKGFIKLLS